MTCETVGKWAGLIDFKAIMELHSGLRAKESNPQERMRELEYHTQSPVSYAEDKRVFSAEVLAYEPLF